MSIDNNTSSIFASYVNLCNEVIYNIVVYTPVSLKLFRLTSLKAIICRFSWLTNNTKSSSILDVVN